MRTHYFKTWPDPFEAAAIGSKPYEIRKDDRGTRLAVGDVVVLREWRPVAEEAFVREPLEGNYTGRELRGVVTYVSVPGTWGLPGDLYVMAIRTGGIS